MKAVGIYVRLSEVRPGEEAVSLDTQERDARVLAKRKGWKVADLYKDSGRSAWSDSRDRPAFDRMLSDLEAGKIGGIVAWKQDRLGRRVAEVAQLLDRCRQLGALVATVTDGLDTTTPSGRMAAQVVAAAAELESANTSIRVRRAMQARAERGDPHGGPRPYGYKRVGRALVVEPTEAAIVRECASRVLAGEGIGPVLRDLGSRNVTTSAGKRWTRRSLVNTLMSSRIAGLRQHDGREVAGSWEPIVDRETLDSLRAALGPPFGATVLLPVRGTPHLLAVWCSAEGPLVGRRWSARARAVRVRQHDGASWLRRNGRSCTAARGLDRVAGDRPPVVEGVQVPT